MFCLLHFIVIAESSAFWLEKKREVGGLGLLRNEISLSFALLLKLYKIVHTLEIHIQKK